MGFILIVKTIVCLFVHMSVWLQHGLCFSDVAFVTGSKTQKDPSYNEPKWSFKQLVLSAGCKWNWGPAHLWVLGVWSKRNVRPDSVASAWSCMTQRSSSSGFDITFKL